MKMKKRVVLTSCLLVVSHQAQASDVTICDSNNKNCTGSFNIDGLSIVAGGKVTISSQSLWKKSGGQVVVNPDPDPDPNPVPSKCPDEYSNTKYKDYSPNDVTGKFPELSEGQMLVVPFKIHKPFFQSTIGWAIATGHSSGEKSKVGVISRCPGVINDQTYGFKTTYPCGQTGSQSGVSFSTGGANPDACQLEVGVQYYYNILPAYDPNIFELGDNWIPQICGGKCNVEFYF